MTEQNNPLLSRMQRHNIQPEQLAAATGYSLTYVVSVLTGRKASPYSTAKLNRGIDNMLRAKRGDKR